MHEKRLRKEKTLIERMRGIKTVNVYGQGDLTIFTHGSTTMSVLEALYIGGIEAKVVQPIYLKPLPVWELARHRADGPIVIEHSATGQFTALLNEKVGISGIRSIKKHDGRPFEPNELAQAIKGVS
jgi:2-oxoglutarate ferredoxin oxidoreductase subunit alpha